MTNSFTIDHLPNRTILHGGRSYLFFSGTAYLGLPQHPAFQQLLIESIGQFGLAFGSSRNGNLRLGVYEQAEIKLTNMVGATAALTLSSGMMAGQVVVNFLRSEAYSFVYGPHAHPALWPGPDVTLPALSFADWTVRLPEQLRTMNAVGAAESVAILVNSIDAVRSEYYDFDWVNDLPANQPITLVVDDSHGLGILDGRGIWSQIPRKSNVRLIVTASLAKAMGLPGGVVFSDADTVADLRRTAFFGACSPMPPAYLGAYLRADSLYAEGRERLRLNIALAEKLLLPTGLFRHATGYPVFFTDRDELYPYLLKSGIFVYSFAYPTTTDRANTRIVISAFHEPEDIHQLAEAVYSYST